MVVGELDGRVLADEGLVPDGQRRQVGDDVPQGVLRLGIACLGGQGPEKAPARLSRRAGPVIPEWWPSSGDGYPGLGWSGFPGSPGACCSPWDPWLLPLVWLCW